MNDIMERVSRTRTYIRYVTEYLDTSKSALKNGVKIVSPIDTKYIIDNTLRNLEVSLHFKFLKLLLTEKYPNTANRTIGTIGIMPIRKLNNNRKNITRLGPEYANNITGIEKILRIFTRDLANGYIMNIKEINERILKYFSNIMLNLSLDLTCYHLRAVDAIYICEGVML